MGKPRYRQWPKVNVSMLLACTSHSNKCITFEQILFLYKAPESRIVPRNNSVVNGSLDVVVRSGMEGYNAKQLSQRHLSSTTTLLSNSTIHQILATLLLHPLTPPYLSPQLHHAIPLCYTSPIPPRPPHPVTRLLSSRPLTLPPKSNPSPDSPSLSIPPESG